MFLTHFIKKSFLFLLSFFKMECFGNISWLLSEKVIKISINSIVSVSVARYLGPEKYGQLNYVFSCVAFFQCLAWSTESIIVKNIIERKELTSAFLGSAFFLRIIIGVTSWLLIITGMHFAHPENSSFSRMSFLVGLILILQSVDCIDLWFQSQRQNKRTVKAKLISYIISAGFKMFLIFMKAPLIMFALAMTLEAGIFSLGLIISYTGYKTSSKWRFDKSSFKSILIQSWPLMMGGFMVSIYSKIDQIMLRDFINDSELGVYSVAILCSQVSHIIPISVMPAIMPYLVQKKLIGEENYFSALTKMFRVFLILSGLLIIIIWLIAPFLIDVLFGPQYHSAVSILRIHIFSLIFVFLDWGQGAWLTNTTTKLRSKAYLTKTISGAILSLCANLYFIPRYGVLGAASVFVAVTSIVVLGTSLIFDPKIFWMQLGINRHQLSKDTLI